MEKLLMQMLEAAKKDKKSFLSLKNIAVKLQQFELAVAIREIEKEIFPETAEEKKAKEVRLLFGMVDLNVSDDVCWLISEVMERHNKKKGKFSINDASDLICKRKQLFNID